MSIQPSILRLCYALMHMVLATLRYGISLLQRVKIRCSFLVWITCSMLMLLFSPQVYAADVAATAAANNPEKTSQITRSRRSVVTIKHRNQKEKVSPETVAPPVPTKSAAEVEDPKHSSEVMLQSPPQVKKSAITKTPVYIDERPIWALLHQGKTRAAHAAVQAAKKKKNGWEPSSHLRQALRQQQLEMTLNSHKDSGAWEKIASLYQQHPAEFDCAHAYRRLYVNTALIQLNNKQQAESLYADTVAHCSDEQATTTLEHASATLSDTAIDHLLTVLQQRSLSSSLQTRVDAIAFHHWVSRGQVDDAPETVLTQLRSMMPRLEKLKRPDIHESLAWMELKFHHPEQALKQFRISRLLQDTDSALKGEVIALYGVKQGAAMRELMQREQLRLDNMNALADLLPLLAAICGEQKDYACQLDTFQKIKLFRPLKADEDEALTWIYYNKEQFTKAADNFERIYHDKQSEGVAKGLFVSLMRLGQTNRASRIAEELGGPFEAIISRGDAERFYMRKLFHTAQAYDESFDASLKHLDADYARVSFMQRRRGGNTLEPVFNQFLQRKLVLEGGTFRDQKHRVFLRYEPTQLDVGQGIIPLGDNFGTNPIIPTPTIYPLQTRHTGYEWNIGYRYEDWLSWYGDIGQGFVHGRLQSTFKGHVGFKQEFLAGFIQGEVFRQPIRESMLSYAGMNDPFTNQSWGRVTRTGVQLNGYNLTGIPDVGLTYQLRAEWMRGVAVQKNRHLLLNVFIPRHFQWFRDTEWSVGPLFQWEAFANDQGHFMWGHGGYFSPQRNNYFGLNSRFISREGRTYNYEFRAFFGAQTYTTKTTPLLPFTPDGRNFLGQTIVEKMYQVQGKIVRDLPWNLQIGASFAWSDAVYSAPAPVLYNNYRELLMSVFLTWQPEERTTTMSSDHPLFGIDTLY